MLKTIQNYLKNEEYKHLFDNFMSLMTLQGLNYILPLITFPYLVRVLGPEKFGLVSFASAFIGYFLIITDYGFNLSATREIALNRENNEKLSEIFSSVMTIKFMLMILSFILMLLVVFSFDKFKADWNIYVFTFGMVFGNVLFPVWFFQGMEKMRLITYLNILSKLVFTVLIFLIIKTSADFIYVPLINSMGYVLAGVLSLMVILHHFRISFKIPSKNSLINQLNGGYHVFISTVSINLYTTSNTFMLGLFTNNTVVGYFTAGYTLINAFTGLITPLSQTIYPHISRKVANSPKDALNFIKNILKYFGTIFLIFSVMIFVSANILVNVVIGEQYSNSIIVIKILAVLPFVIFLSNILGIQTMLTFNYKKMFTKIIILGSIVNILLAIPLILIYSYIGISISILITEIFITSAMYYYIKKKKIF